MGYFILAMIIVSLLLTTLVFMCIWRDEASRAKYHKYQRDILHRHLNHYMLKYCPYAVLPDDLREILDEIEIHEKTQNHIQAQAVKPAH